MKSTSQGTLILRIRSARKSTAPFSTPTMKRSRPAYSSLICRPSSATRCCRSSLETRVSPIAESVTRRSLDTTAPMGLKAEISTVLSPVGGLLALRAEEAAVDDCADAAAEVEHRCAGATKGGHLVGVVGGAGDGAAGGAVGEALDDEAAQGTGSSASRCNSIVPRPEPLAPSSSAST